MKKSWIWPNLVMKSREKSHDLLYFRNVASLFRSKYPLRKDLEQSVLHSYILLGSSRTGGSNTVVCDHDCSHNFLFKFKTMSSGIFAFWRAQNLTMNVSGPSYWQLSNFVTVLTNRWIKVAGKAYGHSHRTWNHLVWEHLQDQSVKYMFLWRLYISMFTLIQMHSSRLFTSLSG